MLPPVWIRTARNN
ncbi:putative diadenosine tetraphosphatase, partial [Serratia symbiotica str. Tucson]